MTRAKVGAVANAMTILLSDTETDDLTGEAERTSLHDAQRIVHDLYRRALDRERL